MAELTMQEVIALSRKEAFAAHKRREKQIEDNFGALAALNSEGFKVPRITHVCDVTWTDVQVDGRKDLPRVRQALGRKLHSLSKELNFDKTQIVCRMHIDGLSGLCVRWNEPLPKGRKAKCKVKTVYSKEKVLVCSA